LPPLYLYQSLTVSSLYELYELNKPALSPPLSTGLLTSLVTRQCELYV